MALMALITMMMISFLVEYRYRLLHDALSSGRFTWRFNIKASLSGRCAYGSSSWTSTLTILESSFLMFAFSSSAGVDIGEVVAAAFLVESGSEVDSS